LKADSSDAANGILYKTKEFEPGCHNKDWFAKKQKGFDKITSKPFLFGQII
jgi:hypothetical protein